MLRNKLFLLQNKSIDPKGGGGTCKNLYGDTPFLGG